MLKKKEEGTGLRFHRVLCPWFGNHQEHSVAVFCFFFGRRISGHNMDDCHVMYGKVQLSFGCYLNVSQSLLLTFVFVEI